MVLERVTNPDSCGTASHGLGAGGTFYIFGSPCRKRTLFLVGNVDSRDSHRIARKCAGTGGRCSVSGQKHDHPKTPASRSEFCSSRDYSRPLSFFFLALNARRFQRTHLFSGMGSSLNASKDIGMGVIDLAPICESEPVMDTVCAAVAGLARARVLDAGSDREDRSSDVCHVGDTR